jgi:hypothetical protein
MLCMPAPSFQILFRHEAEIFTINSDTIDNYMGPKRIYFMQHITQNGFVPAVVLKNKFELLLLHLLSFIAYKYIMERNYKIHTDIFN